MSDVEEKYEDEFRFAQQMKDTCCDESGKETNPAKAAEILHQIGLIYRQRSPDKIAGGYGGLEAKPPAAGRFL